MLRSNQFKHCKSDKWVINTIRRYISVSLMRAAWNVCFLSTKKKSLSNSQEAKISLLKNKTAGVKPQSYHYHVQQVVWALDVKLELGWRFWVSRHAYGRFVPRPALFAVRSTNCRECRVWNTNSVILCPTLGLWFLEVFLYK